MQICSIVLLATHKCHRITFNFEKTVSGIKKRASSFNRRDFLFESFDDRI